MRSKDVFILVKMDKLTEETVMESFRQELSAIDPEWEYGLAVKDTQWGIQGGIVHLVLFPTDEDRTEFLDNSWGILKPDVFHFLTSELIKEK